MRLTDTSPDAERVVREAYRRMSFADRWRQLADVFDTAQWFETIRAAGKVPMTNPSQNVQIVREVIAVLDRLGIAYALGGSWASSLLGKPRYTQDADLAVEPFPGREAEFAGSFSSEYYVSLPAVQAAVRQRSSFNVIHSTSGFKIDLFVRRDRPFEESLMARRRSIAVTETGGPPIYLVSAEDLVLLKLEWYRLGDESSERQWLDVLGVLEVQADRLDQDYLTQWAAELKVSDLLERARRESSP